MQPGHALHDRHLIRQGLVLVETAGFALCTVRLVNQHEIDSGDGLLSAGKTVLKARFRFAAAPSSRVGSKCIAGSEPISRPVDRVLVQLLSEAA